MPGALFLTEQAGLWAQEGTLRSFQRIGDSLPARKMTFLFCSFHIFAKVMEIIEARLFMLA